MRFLVLEIDEFRPRLRAGIGCVWLRRQAYPKAIIFLMKGAAAQDHSAGQAHIKEAFQRIFFERLEVADDWGGRGHGDAPSSAGAGSPDEALRGHRRATPDIHGLRLRRYDGELPGGIIPVPPQDA